MELINLLIKWLKTNLLPVGIVIFLVWYYLSSDTNYTSQQKQINAINEIVKGYRESNDSLMALIKKSETRISYLEYKISADKSTIDQLKKDLNVKISDISLFDKYQLRRAISDRYNLPSN